MNNRIKKTWGMAVLLFSVLIAWNFAFAGGPSTPYEIDVKDLQKLKAPDNSTPEKSKPPVKRKKKKPAKPKEAPVVTAPVEEQKPPVASTVEPATPPTIEAAPLKLTVQPITATDPDQIIDKVLNSIGLSWSKDKVLEGSTGKSEGDRYSIKVDRYLEFEGKRYIITRSGQDPFVYTLLRLLSMSGYKVIQLDMQEGFAGITPKLLKQLDISFNEGTYIFTPPNGEAPRELPGFLATLRHKPSLVFLTETPLDAFTVELFERSKMEPGTLNQK